MIKKSTSLREIEKLTPACSCGECNHGCKFGSGILASDDKKRLADFLKVDEKRLEKKYLEELELFNKKVFRPKLKKGNLPYGQCVFFKGDKCKVHPAKPLQCKIAMGCKEYGSDLIQWFTLNHVLDADDPQAIREWAVFLEHNKAIPGGELKDLVKDKDKLKKILNYGILSKDSESKLPKFRFSKEKPKKKS